VYAIVNVLPGGNLSFNFEKSNPLVANELRCEDLVHSNVCIVLHSFIDLTNVEMNPGPCDRVDCSKTVTADYHRGDVSMFGMSAGTQCVVMSLTRFDCSCFQ